MKYSRRYVRSTWWRRRIHPVFLISSLAVGVLIGALLALGVPSMWFASTLWWVVWAAWLVLLFWRRQRWCMVAIVIVGSMIGYSRGVAELTSWAHAENYEATVVRLEGIVREDPEQGSGSEIRLRVGQVKIDGTSYGGVYWVTTTPKSGVAVERSDKIVTTGTLSNGFGTYAASMFRANVIELHKRAQFDPMLEARNAFSRAIRSVMPDPEAALGVGYLLGQKRALPPEFEEALLATGLTHVVVASGYNLTILVRLSRRLFARISRYTSAMMSGGMVLAFIGVTGMSPSMSRAGLVAGLSLLAWYYGRVIHPAVILVVSAAVSVFVQPSYLWGDIGWMLSFTSFAGVMFLAPLLQEYFFGAKKPGVLRQVIGETFSAQLLTLPLILVTFGVASNVALIANLLVLPLVPLAMLLIFIVGVVASIVPFAADAVALPAYWLLSYMTWVIDYLASVPWARVEVSIDVFGVAILYTGIMLLIVYLKRRTGFSFRRVNLVE